MTGMRAFVQAFAAARKLTLAALANELGYRSKTSLTRIMDDRVRAESIRRVEDALRQRFALTREEEEQLSAAAEMKLYGKEIRSEDREMWRFLRGAKDSPDPVIIRDVMTGDEGPVALLPPGAKQIRLTVVNCLSMDLPGLNEALKRFPDMVIRHYIYAEKSELPPAVLIRGMLPLLQYEHYRVFCCLRTPGGRTLHGISAADAAVCEYEMDGEHRERIIFFQDRTHGTGLLRKGEPLFLKLIGIDESCYVPVKHCYPVTENAEGITGILQHVADRETGRKLLMIKPDIGLAFIPAGLMAAAIREHGFPEENLQKMLPLLAKREQANYDRSRPCWVVVKRGAMMRFAETGHLADHFWGARDFTVEERLQIIDRLIQEQLHGDQFHLLFLARDDAVQDVELIQYQGAGLTIIPAQTAYDSRKSYMESTITHEGINAAFQDFFMRQIVRESCLPESSTVIILREMQHAALASGR